MTFKEFANKIFFLEILSGLALTLKVFFRKPVTIRYPHEKRPVHPGFRGRHALVRDSATKKDRCVVCMKCAMVCPSQCITIKYTGVEGEERILSRYEIEALRCIFCGYCVEVCPVNAIVLTEHYEYAGYNRRDFLFNRDRLLKNWDEFVANMDGSKYSNKFWRPEGIDSGRLPVWKRARPDVPVNNGEDK